jgi:hypothetical protein
MPRLLLNRATREQQMEQALLHSLKGMTHERRVIALRNLRDLTNDRLRQRLISPADAARAELLFSSVEG